MRSRLIAIILLVAMTACPAMAQQQKKISQFPDAGNLQSGDVMVIDRGSSTYKATYNGISGGIVGIPNGGTGATTAAQARANLGISSSGFAYAFDPKSYGAICRAPETFAGNGSAITFTYTIPFTGSNSTDNASFYVYKQPASGSAVILNTAQFTVTGVNSGVGGTITILGSPMPTGTTLYVLHDDTAGFAAASTAAVAGAGYVSVPNDCWVKNLQLADGTSMIGYGLATNYGFYTYNSKPIIHVISPSGATPNFVIDVSGKSQQYFSGFTIVGVYGTVPVCLGANGPSGAGGGQNPGIILNNVDLFSCVVGFGAPVGGNSSYIFAALWNVNLSGNYYGTYGPFSDINIQGGVAVSNQIAGYYIGPQQGAPGGAGAGKIVGARAEYNGDGFVFDHAGAMTLSSIETQGNGSCGINLKNSWSGVVIDGATMGYNGLSGYPNYYGNTTPGQDAHICINGPGSGLRVKNMLAGNGWARGFTAPIGSPNANTPLYFMDVNTAGSGVDNIDIDGSIQGLAQNNNGGYVTDFAIYRNGKPSNVKIDAFGQAVQGKIANGRFSSQARGLPANSSSAISIVGDALAYNNQLVPLSGGFGGLIAKSMGAGPRYYVQNDFSHFDCDVVNNQVIPNISPGLQNNAPVAWMPNTSDTTWGGGFYSGHLIDTNSCHMGGLTWAAIPQDYKAYAQSANCVTTGSWTNSSSYTGKYGVVSNTHDDSMSCAFTTDANQPAAYLWYQMHQNDGGTFTYSLDGGQVTTVATQGQNSFEYPVTTTNYTMGAIRIPVLAIGSHTVQVNVTSTTSASNTVTIEGVGTPPGKEYHGSAPAVYFGGYIQDHSGTYVTAVTAFNQANKDLADQLFADGVSVNFVDVQKYINTTTDYGFYGSSGLLNMVGQAHLADAFIGKMQAISIAGQSVNPRDYGAACNSIYFPGSYSGGAEMPVHTTASSAVISIAGYIFQPGVATKNGGGDVGKRICIGPGPDGGCSGSGNDVGPCTYVASVNTTNNTATLGATMPSSGNCHYAVMGGYPTNPNDPSTALDDTSFIEAAATAAQISGGKVVLPNNCMVHDLNVPTDSWITGNALGVFYLEKNPLPNNNQLTTALNCGITGFSSDTPQCIRSNLHTRFSHLLIRAPVFPYTGYKISATCLGFSTGGTGNGGPGGQVLSDYLSFFGCPIGEGQAYGYNRDVTFTATVADNGDGTSTMTVTSIDSANFLAADSWSVDFLALNRPVSGGGLPANTTIISVPPGGTTGNYIINKGATISSPASLTSAHNSFSISIKDEYSQHIVEGIAYNGQFTDSEVEGSVCTGTFMKTCVRLGPFNKTNEGCGIRWNGGRLEEADAGGGVVAESCGFVSSGLDFQFNGGGAVRTLGDNSSISITGGAFQGNGTCNSASAEKAHVIIGGSNARIAVNGVAITSADYGSGCGGNTLYLFSTVTGATPADVSVTGGPAIFGSTAGSVTNLYNWTNGAPTRYAQRVEGWPYIDTSQSVLSASTTGGIGIGTATPVNGAALDLRSNTTTSNSSVALPAATTANRPTSPATGMLRYNTSTGPTLEYYDGAWKKLVGTPDVAPTIVTGFGTSPTISGTNASSFTVTIGSGGTDSTGTVGLGTAANGWNCFANDNTNPDGNVTNMLSATTTGASFKNYARTTGLVSAWPASDVLAISCSPR